MKNYLRYFYALLAIPMVILTRFALLPLTGHGTPFITLFPATVIIALLGGMGPAVLTGVLGVLISDYFFIEPLHSWDFGIEFWARSAVVVLTSVFVGYVGAVLRESRTRAEKQTVELNQNREDLKRAQTVALTGSWRLDVRKNELAWSDEAYRIFGVPTGTPLTYESFLSYIHPDDRETVDEEWKEALNGGKYDIEHRIVVDGQIKWVRERAELEYEKDGMLSGGFGTVTDVTERKWMEEELKKSRDELEIHVKDRTAELLRTNERLKQENEERLRTEQSLRLEEARLDALLQLSQISDVPIDKITGFTLEQAIALTRSKIGFIGFLSEDESTYTLHAVSKDVVKDCEVTGNPVQWKVEDAGIWADALRERKTLFINDYSKPHLGKKGLPPGHVPMERFLVVPVFVDGRIVAVAGVGNKASNYNESDERQIVLLLNGMWNYVQRNRSRESLLAERQRFNDVLETLPVYVCLLTPDYYMPFANKVFRDLFGYYPDKKCYEFLFDRPEPCDNCETFKVLKTNEPQHWEWTGPNGRDYDIFDFPFRDTDGSQLILEMGIDITKQKQAQEALRSTSLYARGLLEASLDPLVTISPEGKITDVNEATVKVTGIAREQLIGTDFSSYFTEPNKARDSYQQVFARSFVTDYPLTIRHRNGRLTDVLYNATVYKNEEGKVQGVFAAARDITEKKITEAELEQYRLHLEDLVKQRTDELARSNKDLEQFAYVASHDLQEPLRAVSGFVSLLRNRLKDALDDKTKEYMDFTVDGVARMQTLINGLLEYSRIDTRGKPPEKTDSGKSLEEALLCLQMSIKESGAKIIADKLPIVHIDPVQLSQLFQNLISNAIKFHSELLPEIHISASRLNNAWRFAVKDNGIGIEPQYVERIFLIFQRLHTRKKYAGTGIGLSLCKKIVERHGGKIWVESEPGHGSTFYFTIPDMEGDNK
jgi:PAS domain S-box-containing protein